MVRIFLSINNNEEVIEIPVIPEEMEKSSPWNNETFESMKQELNLIGLRGLRSFPLSSFFPVRDYPFLRSRELWGMEYVETIERWRDRRLPIRFILTNEQPYGFNVNMPVTIEDFTYKAGADGDIYYTLSFREFAFVKVN